MPPQLNNKNVIWIFNIFSTYLEFAVAYACQEKMLLHYEHIFQTYAYTNTMYLINSQNFLFTTFEGTEIFSNLHTSKLYKKCNDEIMTVEAKPIHSFIFSKWSRWLQPEIVDFPCQLFFVGAHHSSEIVIWRVSFCLHIHYNLQRTT